MRLAPPCVHTAHQQLPEPPQPRYPAFPAPRPPLPHYHYAASLGALLAPHLVPPDPPFPFHFSTSQSRLPHSVTWYLPMFPPFFPTLVSPNPAPVPKLGTSQFPFPFPLSTSQLPPPPSLHLVPPNGRSNPPPPVGGRSALYYGGSPPAPPMAHARFCDLLPLWGSAFATGGDAWRRRRGRAVAGALYGPAMAEGERAERGGPGRPPREAGAEERAEALKTRANEYFKGGGGCHRAPGGEGLPHREPRGGRVVGPGEEPA